MSSVKTVFTRDNLRMCARIKQIRQGLGLTQPDFAERIGVSLDTVKQIEYKHQIPTIATLRLIVQKCGVSYEYLIDGKKGSVG